MGNPKNRNKISEFEDAVVSLEHLSPPQKAGGGGVLRDNEGARCCR